MKKTLAAVHHTRRGKVALGLMALLLAYVTASLAIDSGRLTQYFLTFALVIIGMRWLLVGFKKA